MSDVAFHSGRTRIAEQSLGGLLANSNVVALAVIRRGRIVFANPAFRDDFHAVGSLADIRLSDLVTRDHGDRLEKALTAAEHAPVTFLSTDWPGADHAFDLKLELEGTVLDGCPLVIAFASLIARRPDQERLAYLAYTDALTGLANRPLFTDRLHQALLDARRDNRMFAVLMMDLDGFKAVNDAYGHNVGDIVLQLAVQRFQRCARDGDTLARLGGDEFAVLLPRMDDGHFAALVAQRMIDSLRDPLDLGAFHVAIGASVGIATYPLHARTADALMTAADTALFGAKRAGRNRLLWADGSPSTAAMVPPVTWSITHYVGIKEIDDQHARLAGLIDALSTALKDGGDISDIVASLQRLISYAGVHFATEERLMAEYGVADQVSHRAAHSRLLDDIEALDVTSDLPSISLVLRYLQEWLFRHIDGFDKALARALIAKGCR